MLEVFTPIEGHKPRLSSRFTWPIGLEALSRYFSDVPQVEDLQVWFDDEPRKFTPGEYPQWTMNRVADAGEPYQICTVWYSTVGDSPRWYLMIYPVERRLRSTAKKLLENEGLSRMHDFLTRHHTQTELIVSHHFRCVFDPTESTMTYEHETG